MGLFDLNDIQSQTWVKIRKHFEERLQDHRIKNDGTLSEIETARLRGKISEAIYILDLETTKSK